MNRSVHRESLGRKAVRRTVVHAIAASAVAAGLGGCGLFDDGSSTASSASAVKGVIATPKAGASVGSSGGASGVGATPAASGSAHGSAKPATTTTPSAVPTLRPKPSASGLPCNAEGLVLHLSQASGAVHAYLAAPVPNAPAAVVALKTATTRATGAKAATYAAGQLSTGLAAATGCATTAALDNVAKQTAAYLTTLSKRLATDQATVANVSAAEALIADVNAQAGRAGLTITDRVVAANLLK